MAITYFGYCDPDTGAGIGTENIYLYTCAWLAAGYACPGSGAQDIVQLAAETNDSPTTPVFRLGLYNAAGNLVVETAPAKNIAYPTAWVSWNASELIWHIGTTLTGGVVYRLVFAGSTTIRVRGTTGFAAGTSLQVYTDYSAGLPATIPSGNNDTQVYNLRCGVQPVVGGNVCVLLQEARRKRI